MNPAGECPDRYRKSVIRSYIYRAYKTCSTQTSIESEIKQCKQILVNNGYSNSEFDKELLKFRNNINNNINTTPNGTTHKIYYCNQMSTAYKTDEKVLNRIISANTKFVNPNDKLKLVTYYKNKKVKNLVMKNNPTKKSDALHSSNVLYEY